MAVKSIFDTGEQIFGPATTEPGPKGFEAITGIETTLPAAPKPSKDISGILSSAKAPEPKGLLSSPTARGGISSALTGLQIGGLDTGSESITSAESIIQILGGAGTGALLGGPIGAVAGGLAAGLGAFLKTRGNKKRAKAQKAKEARYQKMVREQIAREDKFREQERFDKLEEQGFNRSRSKMADQWNLYGAFSKQMTNVINQNEDLKKRFAKEGF